MGLVTSAPGWSEALPVLVIIGYLLLRGQVYEIGRKAAND